MRLFQWSFFQNSLCFVTFLQLAGQCHFSLIVLVHISNNGKNQKTLAFQIFYWAQKARHVYKEVLDATLWQDVIILLVLAYALPNLRPIEKFIRNRLFPGFSLSDSPSSIAGVALDPCKVHTRDSQRSKCIRPLMKGVRVLASDTEVQQQCRS